MSAEAAVSVLALVPARGGSKEVPRKNLRLVGGKTLVRLAVECAQQSKRVTTTVVSTDDPEIAEEARNSGASVVIRPESLASDEATSDSVVVHAVEQLAIAGEEYDIVVLLQPTSPLRLPDDVDMCVDTLVAGEGDTVVSVCEVGDNHPAKMYTKRDGLLVPYTSGPHSRRRQDLPPVYIGNGAVYCTWVKRLLSSGDLMGPRIRGWEMPRSRSININEEMDLALADALFEQGKVPPST